MTFAELSALTGTELREVEFDIPVKDVHLLQKIPEFSNYNPAVDVLKMEPGVCSSSRIIVIMNNSDKTCFFNLNKN